MYAWCVTLAAAASYHDTQEYVDDWEVITAVDLDQPQ